MRAEFFRPDKPDEVVAVAVWDGRAALIETAADDSVGEALGRIFRRSPVSGAGPSTRSGDRVQEVVVEPGGLDWFRMAATVRGEREGLHVRFVIDRPGGWDPAGAYRSMTSWVAAREAKQPG
jgi:hypothetical protein